MKSVEVIFDVVLTKSEIIKLVWDPEVALRLVYVVEDLRKVKDMEYRLNGKYEVRKGIWPDDKVVYVVFRKGKVLDELSFDYKYSSLWDRSLVLITFKTNRLLVKRMTSTIVNNTKLLFSGIYASKRAEGRLDFTVVR